MAHIRFHIEYETRWGEILCVDYKTEKGAKGTLEFETEDGREWRAVLDLPSFVERITYYYYIKDSFGQIVNKENGIDHLYVVGHCSHVLICDRWSVDNSAPVLLRTAFADCIYRLSSCVPAQMELLGKPYMLLMRAVPPSKGWRWGVLGSSKDLGEWQPSAVRYLQRTDVYEWGIPLSSTDFEEGLSYKYVLINENAPQDIIWEEGPNRIITPQKLLNNEHAVQIDNAPLVDLKRWHGAGVVIPVFSLRSRESFGVGDFGDLCSFISWAADTGLSAVQLLPINDTTASGTWHDSYPYNGISVFALHPIYLDLREWRKTKAYSVHEEKGKQLNALSVLDYESVMKEKISFLHDLYDEIGAKVVKSNQFQTYYHTNEEWLLDYARFSALRDLNHTANFRDWKINEIEEGSSAAASVVFYCFVQYLLHNQMSAAHEYARAHGVILKGDIPIGICRDSVPAWVHSSLFHFDGQAGAPPDAFAVNGQNWGFPTYNWGEMSKDGYAWWRSRLAHMENYFDAYRIDHVLGFFRIWEVPYEQIYGILGIFRPALPYSIEEIHSFGFNNDVSYFAKAHASTALLSEKQASLQNEDIFRFFDKIGDDQWALKPEYATQRNIINHVAEGALRDVLLDLVTEVLFIEDKDKVNHYHPRIGAQMSHVFKSLNRDEQEAFNRLHDYFFYERHNEFWANEAMKKIPAVIDYNGSMHSMLPCAEDLGMVPSSVKGVLERLHILSLEIQRMPKEYGVRFGNLQHNPYLSVSTIATHDMPPFRLWWKENKEQTQAFWSDVLGKAGEAPEEATPEICEEVVLKHLESGSMLCLLALQDWLAIDGNLRNPNPEMEQINVPSNPNQYWQYRMHLNIEDLLQATSFNEKVRALLMRSKR